MTQPAQGQGPPTMPKSEEISPMSGPEPETTTAIVEGDENIDSDKDVQARLEEAEELKQEGNDLFRSSKWNEALQSYRNGLARLPKRRDPPSPPASSSSPRPPTTGDEGDSPLPKGEVPGASTDAESQSEPSDCVNVDSPLEYECAKARSVLHANIAACHLKLASAHTHNCLKQSFFDTLSLQGEIENAVKACTEALQDDPSYVRALQRRAQCNEKIGSWSALSSAKEDYTKLVTLLPPSSNQAAEAKRSLRLLEPRIEEAQKREMGEMVDKLKGLGNSVLGRFGLSTDNFKFEPNGQGGYSLNFSRE
ncbi:TPR-like protein [Russula emetica]|nr:TPR-like protein [Russula emetica]